MYTNMNKIAMFEKELNYIHHEWIRDLTKKVVNHIPDYFFEIPASSTGKYHPAYTTGDGGLLRHVQAACKMAHDVLSLEHFSEFKHDAVIAALILHDSCKSGYPNKSKFTKHEHPILAKELIETSLEVELSYAEFDNDAEREKQIKWYISKIGALVESHMGQWNTNKHSSIILRKPQDEDEMLVHIFDFLASRKYINIDLTAQ